MAQIRTQQIIEAAKQAYTPVKTDYSGYVKGMAAINKMIIEKVGLANEQDTKLMDYEEEDFAGINKSILNEENIEFLTNIRTEMAEDSQTMKMSAGSSKNHKQASKRWNDNLLLLQQLKKDATAFTDFAKGVNKNKEFMSEYQNALDQSFLTTILTQPDMVNNNVKFTKTGIQVLGADGNMIKIGDLPTGITTQDGKNVSEGINIITQNIGIHHNNGTWDDNAKAKMFYDLDMLLKNNTSNTIGSSIFDYKYATENGMESYIDILLEKDEDLKKDYEREIQESLSMDLNKEWTEETGLGTYLGPIDTDVEKERLKKMLIRNKDGFNLEQAKDGFKKWVEERVFGYASDVADKAAKKKIDKQRRQENQRIINARTISNSAVDISGTENKFVAKSSIHELPLSIGDSTITGSVLEKLVIASNEKLSEDFINENTEYRMTKNGILQEAVEDEDSNWSWKASSIKELSMDNKERDVYRAITNIINERMGSDISTSGRYFAPYTGKSSGNFSEQQVIDEEPFYQHENGHVSNLGAPQPNTQYTEKVTHTRGSSKGRGAHWQWVHDKWEKKAIKLLVDWINSMGLEKGAKKGTGPEDGYFVLMEYHGGSNMFKMWDPSGNSITRFTGHSILGSGQTDTREKSENVAQDIDNFINSWYRKQMLKLPQNQGWWKHTEIKDISTGGYLGEDDVSSR